MNIARATLEDVTAVAPLFDLYRQFYEQESDLAGAEQFLRERLANDESVIFFAYEERDNGREMLGFTQLYPLFSSVSMKKVWLLNDLYVMESARRKNVGHALLDRAKEHAAETGAKGVTLETSADNYNAQKLYEKTGFQKSGSFYYGFYF